MDSWGNFAGTPPQDGYSEPSAWSPPTAMPPVPPNAPQAPPAQENYWQPPLSPTMPPQMQPPPPFAPQDAPTQPAPAMPQDRVQTPAWQGYTEGYSEPNAGYPYGYSEAQAPQPPPFPQEYSQQEYSQQQYTPPQEAPAYGDAYGNPFAPSAQGYAPLSPGDGYAEPFWLLAPTGENADPPPYTPAMLAPDADPWAHTQLPNGVARGYTTGMQAVQEDARYAGYVEYAEPYAQEAYEQDVYEQEAYEEEAEEDAPRKRERPLYIKVLSGVAAVTMLVLLVFLGISLTALGRQLLNPSEALAFNAGATDNTEDGQDDSALQANEKIDNPFGKSRLHVLLVGLDGNLDTINPSLDSDMIFVLTLDFHNNSATLLNIPSGTVEASMIPIRAGIKQGAGAMNDGFGYTKTQVRNLLGISIDHYIGIDIPAAKRIVDSLGGVTVDVETNLTICQRQLAAGERNLTGQEVMDYCRWLGDDPTGEARARRQEKVLLALYKQLLDGGSLGKLPDVLREVSNNTVTSFSASQQAALVLLLTRFSADVTTKQLPGVAFVIDNASYYGVDQQAKQALIKELYDIDITIKEENDVSKVQAKLEKNQSVHAQWLQYAHSMIADGQALMAINKLNASEYNQVADLVAQLNDQIRRNDYSYMYETLTRGRELLNPLVEMYAFEITQYMPAQTPSPVVDPASQPMPIN